MNVLNVHPIGYELRPHGHHPDLFKALALPLAKRGGKLLPPGCVTEADVICFDTAVWDIGTDGRSGVYSPYDWCVLNYVLSNQLPVAVFDNFDHWGTATYGCTWPGKNDWEDMQKIQKEQDFARFLVMISTECPFMYFMRKMQEVGQSYPKWVMPLDYPLFDDYKLCSKEELCHRPYDVCFLANCSWQRSRATFGIYRDGRLKFDGQMYGMPPEVIAIMGKYADRAFIPDRMEMSEWVGRHRQAKMFMEADASMGSERPQRLMTVAPMLRIKSDHRLPFPREDMKHQVVVGDYDGNISSADVDKVLSVTNSPDLLYSIYVEGAEHMRKHYSIEARSNYIIDHLEKFVR